MVETVPTKSSTKDQPEPLLPLPSGPPVELPIGSLNCEIGIRIDGINLDHVQTLAQLDIALPPILVSRLSNQVIDGRHRLKAALLNGRKSIRAILFDGDHEQEFILAVQTNVAHGLPLTLDDRRAAAVRIIRANPEFSDRSIGITVGLAAKTISAIRRSSTAEVPQSNTRIGRDGRIRPLTSATGRRRAMDLIATNPQASLRSVAREAGISVSTVRNVRERMRAGDDPVPEGQLAKEEAGHRPQGSLVDQPESRPDRPAADPESVLKTLRLDPTLRYSDSGRNFLRWLGSRALRTEEWRSFLNTVSPHCAIMVSKLAHDCAAAWTALAKEFEQRSKQSA